jgi:peptidoglycan hydrolase CwlO-like protein
MKSIIWPSLFATTLIVSGACKKDNDPDTVADRVQDKREDLREAQKDVTDEQKDVNEIRADLSQARADFERSVNERIAQLNAKIDQLEAKGDAKSRELAAEFRMRRDAAKARLNQMASTADDKWEGFKKDVSAGWDELEKDVDEAI